MNVKEYIIYTPEGATIAPNDECAVENCQVLGCVLGVNHDDAIDVLLRDNPWILEAGFSRDNFIVRELARILFSCFLFLFRLPPHVRGEYDIIYTIRTNESLLYAGNCMRGNRPTTGNNCDIPKAVCNKLVRSISLDTPCYAFANGCRRSPVGAWLGVSSKPGDTPFRVRKNSCYEIALQGF